MQNVSRRSVLGLFLAVLAVYLAFPTKDYYWDGVGFALAIEHPKTYPMIEANHPIYIGFGWLVFWAVHHVAPAVRALTVLQCLNSVFAALSVCLIYLLGEELFASSLTGLLLAGVFASAATWWKFATDANAYIPAILGLLTAFRLLLRPPRPHPVRVALTHVAAMMFHQLAVLFAIPAAVGFYLQPADSVRESRLRSAAKYLAVTGSITLALYYDCFYLATGSTAVAEFLPWVTQHTPDAAFSFHAGRNVMMTLRGTLRLFFGGSVKLMASGAVSVMLVAALAAAGFWWVRRRSLLESPKRPAVPVGIFWAWIAAYALFLFFWMPQNTFYRLFYLGPLVLLLGRLIRGRRAYQIAYVMLALAASWNFLFYIYPHSRAENNRVLSSAMTMHAVWRPGALVYQASFNTDNWTISYFNPEAEFRNLDGARLGQVEEESRGRDVWIDQSGLDLLQGGEAGREWLRRHTRPEMVRDFSDGKHRIRFARIVAE